MRNANYETCGKVSEILKLRGSETLDHALTAAAQAATRTKSETARSLIETALFGHLWAAQSHRSGKAGSPFLRQYVDLDSALDALALMHSMSSEQYAKEVLKEHVFGLIHEQMMVHVSPLQQGRQEG